MYEYNSHTHTHIIHTHIHISGDICNSLSIFNKNKEKKIENKKTTALHILKIVQVGETHPIPL